MSKDKNPFDRANRFLYDCANAIHQFEQTRDRSKLLKAIFLIKYERQVTSAILESLEKL